MTARDVEAECQAVYDRTREFFNGLQPQPPALKRGISILAAPPKPRPSVLFIGLQPGGNEEESQAGLPESNELTHGTGRLSKELRSIYGAAFLEQCNATNAIFLRSPNHDSYCREVEAAIRAQIKAFCRGQIEELVRILDPARIVVIGLGVLDRLAPGNAVVLRNEQRVTLATEGRVFGRVATGVVHLSGARGVTSDDRTRIGEHLRGLSAPSDETGPLAA